MPVHPLKQEREARDWSQTRLAEMLGVTARTVARWEQGQTFPYPYYREQLCILFGKNASALGLLPDDDVSPLLSTQEQTQEAFPPSEKPSLSLYDPMVPEALGKKQHLFGREGLLTLLKQRLRVGERPGLTALSGLPGMGKTALAAALVTDRQVQESFRDGILWAGVGPQPDVLSLLARWGTLLGATPPPGKQASQIEEWNQVLRTIIGKRRMLLVLDDVWTVEVALTMQVGGPNCVYLLTTRLPQVAFAFAEQGALSVPELAEEDGVALLERAVPNLVAQEPEQIRALVRAVGGLPLALKLLAHVLSAQVFTGQPRRVQAALARLQEAEQWLRISLPTAPEEHSLSLTQETPLSLQATIAISEQHLSEQARMTLRALAVFPAKPNSFAEEAALSVGQMPTEMLDELWDAGLLESQGPGRYQMHQTIVDHARLQGPAVEARERLVRFTGHYLQDHAQDYEALELELGNLLAALDVAVEMEMPRDLIETINLLVPFLQMRGRYQLGRQYLQRAYDAAITLEDAYSQMKMLQHLAHFAGKLGEYQDAEHYATRGLELAQQLEQLDAQEVLLSTMGQLAFNQGNYSQAIIYNEQALALARQAGNKKRICTLLDMLTIIAWNQGNYSQAQEMAQEGMELARQQGDSESLANMLNSMAQVAQFRGDSLQAEAFLLEALDLTHQLGSREMQVKLLCGLAIVVQDRGDYMQSTVHLLKALELARQIGHRFLICVSLANLADAMLIAGDYVKAEGYLLEGLELARQLEHQGLLVFLANLGEAVGYQGDYARANAYFEESLQLARQQNATWFLSAALASWGDIHLACQHPDAAVQAYQEVLAVADTADVDQKFTAQARYGLARLAAQRGEIALARQLGQQSLATYEAKSHYKAAEVKQWLQHLAEEE